MTAMDERDAHEGGGFLARWARRKNEQRQGRVAPEPPRAPAPAEPPAPAAATLPTTSAAPLAVEQDHAVVSAPVEERPPPPTQAEADAIVPGDEISRFIAPGVDPHVKNTAFRKLFTDPHFNVMDRLDIYIDDYSQPDPIPPAMLRQLVQSKFLGLFDHEEEQEQSAQTPDAPAAPAETTAEASNPMVEQPVLPPTDNSTPHEDADLRLQPDDAAGRSGAGEGARPREG